MRNIAWSNQFNVVYWEIWNEPDLDPSDGAPPTNPRCWGGTVTNFFEFYEIAAKYLKGKFPNLKIGGPAVAHGGAWADRFLDWCRDRQVPLDFFSWHVYARTPAKVAERTRAMRQRLDARGFTKTESILNARRSRMPRRPMCPSAGRPRRRRGCRRTFCRGRGR